MTIHQQETGLEASRANPCPLCDRDKYCYLIQDELGKIFKAVCQWTADPPDGWDRISTAKDGRGVFLRHGYRRTKRKAFPDFIQLSPKPIPDDIPEWRDVDAGDRAIVQSDLVIWNSNLYEVVKTKGGNHQGQWQILVTIRSFGSSLSGSAEVPESELAIATHDPKTGDREQEIEYLYPGIGGGGKVVRRQWTDRRRVYESRRKNKQVRPYYWLGRSEGGGWSQGKGERSWGLYREEEAREEILRGGIVFACAGEQAVEAYRSLGLVATTCQGGEANFKEILERLRDSFSLAKADGLKPVLAIHPDHDVTGESKFGELLKECEFAKVPAALLEPLQLWAEMPIGGDIWDLVHRSGMKEDQILNSLETAIDEAIDRQELELEAQKTRERWQAPEAYRGELGYWKEIKEDGETIGRFFRPQADFDFQVERELISEDGGGLVLQVKRADDASQRRVFLKSSEYGSVQKFTDALKRSLGGGIVCNLSIYSLQSLIRVRLHEYRVTRRGKAYRLIDRIGQQTDGTWVFKDSQFTRDGNPTTEEESLWVYNPEITGDETHFKSPAIAGQNPQALRQLVEAMQRAFGSNFPLALLTLGYGAAGVHYQEIQEREGAFPILNLYGDPASGKTTAAECALSLMGQQKEGMMAEVSVSAAYERLKLAGGLLHCLDDPKRDEMLDEFLKGFYNAKARVVRGKDNAGFNTQKPHSPLMVTSNHACGENSAATQSRLVRLFFPKVGDGDGAAFRELQALQIAASGCFTDLVKMGYPAQEIYDLEMELAEQIPNAHLRIAKSLALLLCYATKVAELAGIDTEPLKQYVMEVVCAQVNDPDESGDSLRDFLEKVFSLQSESKIGEWNCRWIDKEAGSRVLSIYVPGVWTALDREFNVSYNRKIIESLLISKGLTKTRANFHAFEDQSRAYYRAKLTASNDGNDEPNLNPPDRTQRWCYELSEDFLRGYSEKSGGAAFKSSRSSSPEKNPETPDGAGVTSDDLLNHQRSSEIIKPEGGRSSDDLSTPSDDISMTSQIIKENPDCEAVSVGLEGSDDLDDLQNANGHSSLTTLYKAPIEEGSIVSIDAAANWIRNGSDKLPYQEVPKNRRSAPEVPLSELSNRLFRELMAPSKVLKVDRQRVKVRSQDSGRTSVFAIEFVHALNSGEEDIAREDLW